MKPNQAPIPLHLSAAAFGIIADRLEQDERFIPPRTLRIPSAELGDEAVKRRFVEWTAAKALEIPLAIPPDPLCANEAAPHAPAHISPPVQPAARPETPQHITPVRSETPERL